VIATDEDPSAQILAGGETVHPGDRVFIVLVGFFRQGEEGRKILETQGLLANKVGSDAQVMSPVRPSHPMVARYSSRFSVGEQSRWLPSERSSSKTRTWRLKVPRWWWFLLCTSLAMALPKVTKRVPKVTGGNQPWGTPRVRISASSTPASQRSAPVAGSKAMTRSRGQASMRVAPSLRYTSP